MPFHLKNTRAIFLFLFVVTEKSFEFQITNFLIPLKYKKKKKKMNIISKNNTVRNTSLRESPCIYATCTRTVEYTSFVEHFVVIESGKTIVLIKPSTAIITC